MFFDDLLKFDVHHLNILLVIGLAIFLGTVGARIFQRLHVPQIIGYVAIGILLGPILKVISPEAIESFDPFNFFALGIIGFLIGGELRGNIFQKFGKQIFYILLFEGLTAFILVSILCSAILLYFFNWQTSIAAGLVFGAICSATDPASTIAVLWEYKTRGSVTTMLKTIVALDDALAMVLYIIGISIAGVLIGHSLDTNFSLMLASTAYETLGSIALGVGMGYLLRWIIYQLKDNEKILIFTISTIILNIGIASSIHLDVILSSMAFGVTLINIAPRRSPLSFELIGKFSPPVYVLFFVVIGARFSFSGLGGQVGFLAAAYIIGSVIGKALGSYWGAVYSKADGNVRKYLGFCLYQQGTIAIALLMMASTRFEGQLRDTMLSVIIIGVFVFQLIGPVFVRLGVKKAGEIGLGLTEEDLIKMYTVSDVMDSTPSVIRENMPLPQILNTFSQNDSLYYPVVDASSNLQGIITIAGIKDTFAYQQVADWLLACDVAQPVLDKTTAGTELLEALEKMRKFELEYMPVVSDENEKLVGLLDRRLVNKKISAEILRREKASEF